MNDFGFDGPRRPLIWRILLSPFTLIGGFFQRFAGSDELKGRLGFAGWLKLIFVSPFVWLFSNSGSLILGWSSSRQASAFFMGVPAFLFALTMIAMYSYGTLAQRRVSLAYRNELTHAKATEKLDDAEILLNKLMRIDQENLKERRLEKVDLLMKQNKTAEAYRLLLELTNPENPESVGNPAAHALLARYYQSDEFFESTGFEEMPPAEQQRFRLGLEEKVKQAYETCVNADPTKADEVLAREFLYSYYLRRKDYQAASPHLRALHALNPLKYAIPHYSFFTKNLPLLETADLTANADAAGFRKLVQATQDHRVWRAMTMFNVARREFRAAMEDLQLAKPANMEDAVRLRLLKAGVLSKWTADLKETDPVATRAARLELLSRSLKFYPTREAIIELVLLGFPLQEEDDEWLYDLMATAQPGSDSFYGVKLVLGLKASFEGDSEEAERLLAQAGEMSQTMPQVLTLLRATMEERVVGEDGEPVDTAQLARDNNAPAVGGIFMILGGHAVVNEDYSRGKIFFEKALEINPKSTNAANNLAVCISQQENSTDEELNRALQIVTDAVTKMPKIPNYYETRGAIYMKMGQYDKAILDLEKALTLGFSKPEMVWRKLAVACRKTGRDKEADAYERSLKAIGEAAENSEESGDAADDESAGLGESDGAEINEDKDLDKAPAAGERAADPEKATAETNSSEADDNL